MAIDAPPIRTRRNLLPDGWVERLVRKPMTVEEYFALPESNEKIEWVDGYAVWSELTDGEQHLIAPLAGHAIATFNVGYLVKDCWPDADIRVGFMVQVAHRFRVPDLVVADPTDPERRFATRPPFVVVEVLSPSTLRQDLLDKADEYAAFGVGQYWVVDPEDEVVSIRENRGGAWHPLVVLDENNPTATVVVQGNEIALDRAKVFG